MEHDIRSRLFRLAGALDRLVPAYWSALHAAEGDSPAEAVRTRREIETLCDSIERLAATAVQHFATSPMQRSPDGGAHRRPLRLVVKAHRGFTRNLLKSEGAIAGRPGVSLLPAPTNPAVERWQRVLPLMQPQHVEPPRQPVPAEQLTAGHAAMVVRPSSEYETFLAKQLSPETRRAYRSDMRHFLDDVGLEDPEELLTVGPNVLIAYRNAQIEAGVAPATIARRLSVLRSFFSMLLTLGRIERNPADPKLIRSPRVDREGKTPGIEPQEARALLRAPDTNTLIGKRDRATLAIGLYMGLRRAEIAGLSQSDMRQERGHHVLEVHGKGGKSRVLPIPPKAFSALQEYLSAAGRSEGETDAPLFASMGHAAGEGRRLTGRDVWNIIRKYAEQAGVGDKISPHSMRVAAITSALDHGAPIHRVQIMAGHADPRTTTRYYRAGEDLDESATYAIRY